MTMGPAALGEATLLARELIIQPDAITAIVRDQEGKFRTITNQHELGAGAAAHRREPRRRTSGQRRVRRES